MHRLRQTGGDLKNCFTSFLERVLASDSLMTFVAMLFALNIANLLASVMAKS